MLKEVLKPFSVNLKKWLLILAGSITWSLTMVKSGLASGYGIGFWGANGHDGIWHIALIESISKGSFQMPVFAGQNLQNYHIGFDLIAAFLHRVTFIPVVNLYFQVLPPVFAFLIGYLTYKFVFEWTKSENSAFWSTFFVYFGGSLGFLIGKGESAFWSQQAISSLINPPFALSIIFILLGLIFLQKGKLILPAIFFGILIETKIYAGLLVLTGLLIAGVYSFYVFRASYYIRLFFITFALSFLIYLPLNRSSASLIVWQPFWFLETMMGLSDRIGWEKFYSAMLAYRERYVWAKMVPAYLTAFAIFIAGNFGTRVLFLFRKINLKKLTEVEVFIYSIIFAGILVPTFFLQKGTPWNTIQFFYYSLFFSGILAGITLSQLAGKFRKLTILIYIITVLLTLPTTLATLKDVYIPSRPPAKLSGEEIAALNFLKNQPDGAVLTYPFDSAKAKEAENSPPRPLYLYESTAYVSAFSSHPTFLEDQVNLDITGYDWKDRRTEIENWYKEKDQKKAREFLKDNDIKYIYWIKPQRAFLGGGQLGLKNIFENREVIIYAVE